MPTFVGMTIVSWIPTFVGMTIVSWIPIFVGMTIASARSVNLSDVWYNRRAPAVVQFTNFNAESIVEQKPPSTVVICAEVGAWSDTPMPRFRLASDAA